MASQSPSNTASHPFIDIAVLDGVREPFGEARPVLVLAGADRVVWANAAGAGMIGRSVEDAIGSRLGRVAARQVAGASRSLDAGRTARAMVRLAGSSAPLIPVALSVTSGPGGQALTVLAANGAPGEGRSVADEILRSFEPGTAAAVFADPGPPAAATPAFEGIAPDVEDLIDLRGEVAGEADRLVKRIVRTRDGPRPAGIARLSDEPRLDLLLVIAEGTPGAATGSSVRSDAVPDDGRAEPIASVDPGPAADAAPSTANADLDAGDGAATDVDIHPDLAPLAAAAAAFEAGDGSATLGGADGGRSDGPPGPAREARPSFSDMPSVTPAPRPDGLMPLRFTWGSDPGGRFTAVDAALTDAVGLPRDALTCVEPREIEALLPADRVRLGGALAGEDAFSNRTVAWAVPSAGLRVPVAFSAIPQFGENGAFAGHRGFGTVRLGDAVLDDAMPDGTFPGATMPGEMTGAGAIDEGTEASTPSLAPPSAVIAAPAPAIGPRAGDGQGNRRENGRDVEPEPTVEQPPVETAEAERPAHARVRRPAPSIRLGARAMPRPAATTASTALDEPVPAVAAAGEPKMDEPGDAVAPETVAPAKDASSTGDALTADERRAFDEIGTVLGGVAEGGANDSNEGDRSTRDVADPDPSPPVDRPAEAMRADGRATSSDATPGEGSRATRAGEIVRAAARLGERKVGSGRSAESGQSRDRTGAVSRTAMNAVATIRQAAQGGAMPRDAANPAGDAPTGGSDPEAGRASPNGTTAGTGSGGPASDDTFDGVGGGSLATVDARPPSGSPQVTITSLTPPEPPGTTPERDAVRNGAPSTGPVGESGSGLAVSPRSEGASGASVPPVPDRSAPFVGTSSKSGGRSSKSGGPPAGAFGRRLAAVGKRVVRKAGTEDGPAGTRRDASGTVARAKSVMRDAARTAETATAITPGTSDAAPAGMESPRDTTLGERPSFDAATGSGDAATGLDDTPDRAEPSVIRADRTPVRREAGEDATRRAIARVRAAARGESESSARPEEMPADVAALDTAPLDTGPRRDGDERADLAPDERYAGGATDAEDAGTEAEVQPAPAPVASLGTSSAPFSDAMREAARPDHGARPSEPTFAVTGPAAADPSSIGTTGAAASDDADGGPNGADAVVIAPGGPTAPTPTPTSSAPGDPSDGIEPPPSAALRSAGPMSASTAASQAASPAPGPGPSAAVMSPSAEGEAVADASSTPAAPVATLFAEGALDGAEIVDLVPVLSQRPARPAPPVDTRLLDELPLPVLVQDRTGLLHANPPFLKLSGYPSLAALEGAGGVSALFDEAPGAASASNDPVPMRLKRADGTRRPVAATMQSVPWRGTRSGSAAITGGSCRALLLTLRPLDDRGRPLPGVPQPSVPGAVEDRLASLNAVLDEATDGVVFLDEDRRIRSLSRSAEALFGYGDEEVRGRSFAVLFAPESQGPAVELVSSLGGDGPRRRSGLELDAMAADGSELPLFVTIGAMRDDGGYCAVLRDVSEWRSREGSLRVAADEAEEVSRRKSRFLARVSHEIRTPLNAIIGFAEVMAEERLGPVGNPKYREYLADIRSSGRHVLDLVNDLLDIARIEAGREDLRFEAVELPEVAREALALVSTQAADGRILVRTDMHDVPPVVADRRSLKQVLLNVLANAVNYTAPGGQVIVSVRGVDGGVTVRVRDTGVGMDEADIARALEPFGDPPTKVSASEDGSDAVPAIRTGRRGNGVGLGLPLSKALAEANRARFAISSVRGRGTLVELHFPRERVLE